jgi:hypothetical protein
MLPVQLPQGAKSALLMPHFRKEADVSAIQRMISHRFAKPFGLALAALIGLTVSAGVLYFILFKGTDAQSAGGIEELLYARLREDGCIKHPCLDCEIHVRSINGRKLQDAIFKRRSPDGDVFDAIAYAREAELRVDVIQKHLLIDLSQCQIVQRDGAVAFVEARTWSVDLPPTLASTKVRAASR